MSVLRFLFHLCLLRASPADVPASEGWYRFSLAMAFISSVWVNRIDETWQTSLWLSAVGLLWMLAFVAIVLKIKQLQTRFVQTITALALVSTVMNACAYLPLQHIAQQPSDVPYGPGMVGLLVLLIWSLLIYTHIFRHALTIKPFAAVWITLLYLVTSLVIVGMVMAGLA